MKHRHTPKQKKTENPERDRTPTKGKDPKADDATHRDVYHDDNRPNMYDPEVGESLKRNPDEEL